MLQEEKGGLSAEFGRSVVEIVGLCLLGIP
jgi:hypothetical protein